MFDDYVQVDTTPLYAGSSGRNKVCHLLWRPQAISSSTRTMTTC